ncbi:relaxase/mobilization nuclease domain family protein [Streptococcus sanguinis]|nr:relaxase/mobilization nuclease domain family protein [Streptococcus sanguinis]
MRITVFYNFCPCNSAIFENRYSHRQYEVYRKTNYKYEIKQRVYFLIENSKNFEDFKKKAKALHLKIDFRHKHVTFFMTDSNMKQVVRDSKLSRKQPYNETYFEKKFVQREIINILEFLLPKMKNMNELIQRAENIPVVLFHICNLFCDKLHTDDANNGFL